MNLLLLFMLFFKCAYCWEMELYDLVEELDRDFYTVIGVDRNASYRDIRSAFKKLSLQLHPDKNDAEDAEVVFRQLVDVYNVLKDDEKRKRYDDVLENGLPDWRHAVYYYRHVRKMGILEMLTILFIIITIGQYLTAWASFFEKNLAINEFLDTHRKRMARKQRKGKIEEIPDMDFNIPRPSVFNTLPFQIPCFLWHTVISLPMFAKLIWKAATEKKVKVEESSDEEEVEETWTKGPRRRRNYVIPEGPADATLNEKKKLNGAPPVQSPEPQVPVSGGLWTDDDLAELIKLVNRYPPGTAKRWEKVAEGLRRPVPEVIHMSKKVKEGLTTKSEIPEEPTPIVEKVKTKGGKGDKEGGGGEWSISQHKALEEALVKYPKQISERWDLIAKAVPGKTKKECIQRCRSLAEDVRKKKEMAMTAEVE